MGLARCPIRARRRSTGASASMTSITALGVNAVYLGVQPGSPDDQTQVLLRAIERACGAGVPLVLAPGVYRAGHLELPTGSHLIGMPGATRVVAAEDGRLASTNDADYVTLSGLIEGNGSSLPDREGLLRLRRGRRIRIERCEAMAAGGHAIVLEQVEGEIAGNVIVGPRGAAILSRDARGLVIVGNTIESAGNNGILIWGPHRADDGTLVADNRIEAINAKDGGSGQNVNAINIFHAGNVIVRGNRIRSAAFSAIRAHSASNLQIASNSWGEVALHAEFGLEGAVIANNTVDGAAIGISITNFDHGGCLAVVQGNLVRNLMPKRPAGANPDDVAGVGIAVRADTAVTSNRASAQRRHWRRLGSIAARRDSHWQHRSGRPDWDRGLGRGGRRLSTDRQQFDRGCTPTGGCGSGVETSRRRRPDTRGRQPIRPA